MAIDDTTLELTPPQIVDSVIAWDGELSHRLKTSVAFYRKVREMRRDPTVRLVRQFAVAPIVAGKWTVEAKDDAPEGAKEFIQEQIDKHRLKLIVDSMYGMMDYGWQGFERVIEDLRGQYTGMWGIKWLKPLLHDISTILVDPEDGSFFGIRQQPLTTVNTPAQLSHQIDLFADNVLLFNADVEGTNWYGEPVMKALEALYDEQAQINKSARKYDTRIAGSHWVVHYPLGTSKYKGVDIDNGALAQELIRNIEAMGGIAIPASVVQVVDSMNEALAANPGTQWQIELLSDKGSGQTPFLERYKYIDILKVRAFGFPERALLEGQFGTKAEAEAHADLAILNLEMKHEQLIQQVNPQFVDWHLRVNYGPEAECSVYVKAAPLADRAISFLREVYKSLLLNRDGLAQELYAVDWKAFRDKLDIQEVEQPLLDETQQYDEYGNPIAPLDVETVDPITGMPVTDPSLIPMPAPSVPLLAAARDMDGRFGDGGKTLEQKRALEKTLEHRAEMQKLKQQLEGEKTKIEINNKVRTLIIKEVRTSIEAGRRKVAYTHTGEAYDLENNHVASVVRFPAGNWKEG